MFRQFLSSTLARPTGRIGMAAVLLLAGAAAGCQDQPQDLVTAPDAASASGSGLYAPGLDPEVRTTPFFLTPGRTQRLWFRLTNNAPTTRSYWFGGAELSGSVDVTGWNPNTSLAPGQSRWVWIEVRARNDVPDGTQRQILFGAHDDAGDAYGVTNTSLDVLVTSSRPRVGFVQADYRVVHGGQDHQEVYPGEIKPLRVQLENPGPNAQTICARWLTDEGYFGQTETPQGQTCLDLPAYRSGAVNFAYKVKSSATPGATDRQTVVVYSLADPNALTYGYLKTTTVSSPTVVVGPGRGAFRRFQAWTIGWKEYPHNISMQSFFTAANQERQFVQADRLPDGTLQFSPNPQPAGCNLTCLTTFASSNPGRLYVVWDEPGQRGITPLAYADFYRRTVEGIRAVDPTARFSPAGFERDIGQGGAHWTAYAESFISAYRGLYHEDPPVSEWRFNVQDASPYSTWETAVAQAVTFARSRGAPLVVSFGFPNTASTASVLSDQVTQMSHLKANPWVVTGVWFSYDVVEPGTSHLLVDSGGNLTPEGTAFVNNM